MRPPIPTVEATCPKCGQNVEAAHNAYCPNCGALLTPAPSPVSGLKIFGAICLGLLVLPLGAAGACFLFFSGWNTPKVEWGVVGIAAGLLICAALCIWGIIKLLKR